MKKLFAVAAVAGMVVFTSCGNAEDLAKQMQDSIARADSMMKIEQEAKADSMNNADSLANLEAMMKTAADSTANANHQDSVAKGLIK